MKSKPAFAVPSRPANPILRQLSPDNIRRNPENPRLFFRAEEADTLLASIRRYGIQVPVSVYERKVNEFVLIDGERRWRTALKLNLKTMPAIVQPKPEPLENLLLMFNIHALREQWDYLTLASKLPSVIRLYKVQHNEYPTEAELSELTGLSRGQIRRCRYLIDLPQKYTALLTDELNKPKKAQRLSEDLFIEMERSLKTVQSYVPRAIEDIDEARVNLINKYKSEVIENVTDFRKIAKIARAVTTLAVKEQSARASLRQIFSRNTIGIDEVYSEHFELRYDERKLSRTLESVKDFLESNDRSDILTPEVRLLLSRIRSLIDEALSQ